MATARSHAFLSLLASRSESLRAEALALADLDAKLDGIVDAAKAAWPSLLGDEASFLEHLAHTRREGDDLALALTELNAPDLCLAWACARGNREAIVEVESRSFGDLEHAFRRYASLGRDISDVKQIVRTKLFVVADGERPKIADYAAKGSLKSFLRVVFTNLLSNMARSGQRELPLDDALLDALPDRSDGVEVAHVKALYKSDLRASFLQAVEGLTTRDRNMLRYAYSEGLALEQVAAIYGVQRTTAGRWLAQARESLVTALRADLIARLRVSGEELESVLRVAISQVDITIAKVLQHPGART